MKRIVMVLVILAMAGGAAFAFDIFTFPEPIEPGCILISPTANLGISLYGFAISATVSGDYALPIPMMVGIESGYGFTTEDWGPKMIPILARVSWHPNFEVHGMDNYIRLKAGYTVAFGDIGGGHWTGGFSYGGCVGTRYFFNDYIGIFGEAGFDAYGISYQYDEFYLTYSGLANVYTFFHLGVTIMF